MVDPNLLDLLDDPGEDRASIDERFARFHARHPEVYDRLRDLALDLVARGRGDRLAIAMLWEVLRYERIVAGRDEGEAVALDNSYRSRYARLLMAREPVLRDVFETRRLRGPREVPSPA